GKPVMLYALESGTIVWGSVTPGTSIVVPVVTGALIVSGGTTSVARGGLMRVCDFEETVTLVACPQLWVLN
ncbi:hypothetical protein HAX54_047035, partial [Datura stramonium]|nr:hypothetical protein [Datura stramonium]